MEPFTQITAIAAPLLRPNIDTDAIIPSREMKRVSKHGLAEGLFAGWRYLTPDSRDENPDFVLNQAPYTNAQILLGGENFGCGSSREHAVWALHEWGIRAIIAPSFGAIFYANCIRNGILPVRLDKAALQELADWAGEDPDVNKINVNLRTQHVGNQGALEWRFGIDAQDREMLLEGLDAIALTLTQAAHIEQFEAEDREIRPWVYSGAK